MFSRTATPVVGVLLLTVVVLATPPDRINALPTLCSTVPLHRAPDPTEPIAPLEPSPMTMAALLHWHMVHLATLDGLDGGAPAQFPFDRTEDAALLARDEDTVGVWRIVAAVSFVDIGALDLAAGERLGVLDDVPQRVTVVRIARH